MVEQLLELSANSGDLIAKLISLLHLLQIREILNWI